MQQVKTGCGHRPFNFQATPVDSAKQIYKRFFFQNNSNWSGIRLLTDVTPERFLIVQDSGEILYSLDSSDNEQLNFTSSTNGNIPFF